MPILNLRALQAELAKLHKRGAQLESMIKAKAERQFRSLPARVNLRSVDALIAALVPYGSPKLRGSFAAKYSQPQTAKPVAAKAQRSENPKRRAKKQVRYSASLKAAVQAELKKGGKTLKQLSKQFGPSADTIKDWKKSWGLTKPRKKRA